MKDKLTFEQKCSLIVNGKDLPKDKEIEEMAKEICLNCKDITYCSNEKCTMCFHTAEKLIEQGYRKIAKDSVVLSREEYDELEDLRLNHSKDLWNTNKSYNERIEDTKLEYGNHIKNLEKIIDRQSRDLNSQADRIIDLKEALENKSKETAEKIILSEIATIKNIRDACVLPTPKYKEGYIDCCNGILFYLKNNVSKQFGVEIKE